MFKIHTSVLTVMFSVCAGLHLKASFPKQKVSSPDCCVFPRDGLCENKELLGGEIKSQLLSATVRLKILPKVVKEEPPGHLVWPLSPTVVWSAVSCNKSVMPTT